jgi:glycosyltransferase involved in cell wall biosynthesis
MTTDAVGGVWTYATELIAALNGLGVEVDLAVIGPPPTDEQRKRLPDLASYRQRPFRLEWMEDPWDDVARTTEWLLELAADVDVVHLNGYAYAAADFRVPVLVVGHSCVLSWHEAVHGSPPGASWSRYRDAVEAGLDAADVVIAPTRAMLAELERLYRSAGERRVIPNGRSDSRLAPGAKAPYVLGVGRVWDEAKNLQALERVASRLEWQVLVAGEGGALGRVDDATLHRLYASAAVFAEPARYEPFGLAALEAGLAGCALVLGAIGSLREVWGDAALYVDPFDDDALAAALERVIADELLRRRLADAARRRATRYARAGMAAAYADLYERLAVRDPLEVPA